MGSRNSRDTAAAISSAVGSFSTRPFRSWSTTRPHRVLAMTGNRHANASN